MDWLDRHSTLVLSGGVVVLLLLLGALLLLGPDQPAAPPSSTPPQPAPTPSSGPGNGRGPAGDRHDAPTSSADAETKGTWIGFSKSLPRHRVTLRVTADRGVSGLYWTLPRAKGATRGRVSAPGSSWSITKTVSGPAWVGLYAYIGERRGRIECTVTFDGKVISHQVATGPWGQVYCAAG